MIKKKTVGAHKGQWMVRIQPRDKVTGKQISWPIKYVATKKEAKLAESQMWAEYKSGLDVGKASDTFSEDFDNFVNQKKDLISPVTFRDWHYSATVFKQYFGNAKISDITEQSVGRFARQFVKDHHSTVGRATVIAHRLTHMRNFFKPLEGTAVKINPVPEKALSKFFKKNEFDVGKKRYVFSNEELELIRQQLLLEINRASINNIGTRLAIWIALETGMRPGEIQAVRFSNVTDKDGYSVFKINDSWSDYTKSFNGALKSRPHGYYRYTVPISYQLVQFLEEYHKQVVVFLKEKALPLDNELVLVNLHDYRSVTEGRPITQRSMNLMLDKICNELGIDGGDAQLSMYSFRHTICTKLANKPGISYPWAAERMGHSLAVFMRTYVHSDRDMDKKMMDAWMS